VAQAVRCCARGRACVCGMAWRDMCAQGACMVCEVVYEQYYATLNKWHGFWASSAFNVSVRG
jgi:hypothetical protein